MADCEECIDCKSTKSNLCSKFPFEVSPSMLRYNTSRFTDLNGEIIHHFIFVSSFSEYTVVDIANLLKIDPAIPPNRACLLSCGVSTGMQTLDAIGYMNQATCSTVIIRCKS
jgi:S-(hydroxymethyl)glutathione dehydrogenase/alcohol dehydrogenase